MPYSVSEGIIDSDGIKKLRGLGLADRLAGNMTCCY